MTSSCSLLSHPYAQEMEAGTGSPSPILKFFRLSARLSSQPGSTPGRMRTQANGTEMPRAIRNPTTLCANSRRSNSDIPPTLPAGAP